MKNPTFRAILLLVLWSCVSAKSLERQIAKRQICSSGGCVACDGKSCNVCSNTNNCCSSVSCNKCVNQCSNNCNTASCNNNCVTGCSNTCQAPSCQVQTCSQCVNQCATQCSNDQCVNNCVKGCDCKDKEQPENPPIIIEPSQPSNVIVNNTNNNVVNLTTHINIDNVVNNYNNISVPIFINTTNINNIDVTSIENRSYTGPTVITNGSHGGGGGIVPYPIPYPVPGPQPIPQPQPNCCYVMHPRRCYTDDNGQDRCYIRRHRECSNYCTSPVVTIQQDDQANSGCIYTPNYPFAYCGNYVRRDCGQCYTCDGYYNPGECFQRNECSDVCRRSVPNCVPSQSGLQCY